MYLSLPQMRQDQRALVLCVFLGNIVCVGFSLGGITLCNFLSQKGDLVPAQVKGSIAVSGAFRCDFMNYWRYKEVRHNIKTYICKWTDIGVVVRFIFTGSHRYLKNKNRYISL